MPRQAPLFAAAAIVATGPLATAAVASGHVLAAMGSSLSNNLIAAGLDALCRRGQFTAGEEYREQLANHDIRPADQ